jgi:alpha-beta hydrolase superfamily lysophospholipase
MTTVTSLTLLLTTLLGFFVRSSALPASDNKPAVILVPGAFHKAAVYSHVTALLTQAGYTTDAVDFPSIGGHAAQVLDRTLDIDAVKSAINARLSEQKDIILVGNSYGATVIGEAVKDLEHLSSNHPGKAHRPKIIGLVMVSPYF